MSRRSQYLVLVGVWVAALAINVPLWLGGPASSAEAARPARTPVPRADTPVTISWVGDMTLGSAYGLPPDGGRALFASVRGRLRRSDLTLGNLEGTLSVGGASKCGADDSECYAFQAPPASAAALRWAGIDAVNLANNHAHDYGDTGLTETRAALDAARVAHTGAPGEVTVLERRGVRIAVVGFAPYPWANQLSSVAPVIAAARQQADVVVVLAHLGAEGNDQTHVPVGSESLAGEDRGDTRGFAHAAIDAGADLVLASGPHVLRGLERYRDKLIAYSLGNFAGWHNFATGGVSSESGILTVRVSRAGAVRGGRLDSLRLDAAGVPSRDRSAAAAGLVDTLAADFGTDGVRVGRHGRLRW